MSTNNNCVRAQKAYKNTDFLNSSKARNIRILCELEETTARLEAHDVNASILFFGSARAKTDEDFRVALSQLEASLAEVTRLGDRNQIGEINKKIKSLMNGSWMSGFYEKVVNLSQLLTEWSINSGIKLAQGRTMTGVSRYAPHKHQNATVKNEPSASSSEEILVSIPSSKKQTLVVCTGGGPGFMEAANKGASLVPGARTMGMAITLPFEDGLNSYVTEDLAFEYHYFFTRKFWMVHSCQALVVAPGGVGTMDELFEVLTLRQTGKVQADLPVVLFGAEFWRTIVNWQALADFGVVSQYDVDSLFFTDSVQEAFDYITQRLTSDYDAIQASASVEASLVV